MTDTRPREAANDNLPVRANSFATLAERRAWLETLTANDNKPRKARTATPRHADLATRLRALLTWRAASAGSDWTSVAENDNEPGVPPLLDSTYEIRPRLSEIERALKDVEFTSVRHARLGGGGDEHVVPVGGDIEYGPNLAPRRKREKPKPPCVARLGSLRFSNGQQAEWAAVRTEAGIQYRHLRIPLGGIVDCNGRKVRDRFGAPKSADPDEASVTVGGSVSASRGALVWQDPVANNQNAATVRAAVDADTAAILDLALRASNFKQIGQHLGHRGKHAERKGKEALLAACEKLDAALAE